MTRVALITGAASGIGREVARLLAGRGVRVAAVDRDASGLETLAGELGSSCAIAVADVTDAAGLRRVVAELEGKLGPIDLLIASAGIGLETSALDYRPDDVAAVIGVNLVGVSNIIAAVLPGMLERKHGHVVALSSVASFRGLPRMIAYSASKAGLNALLDGIRVEVEPLGVAVTTVCPCWVKSPMTAVLKGRLDGIISVETAARHVLHAVDTKPSFYTFPRRMALRLRLLTWLPRRWQDRAIRTMLGKIEVTRP